MGLSFSARTRQTLRRATLLGLVALVALGLLAYRDYFGARRAWRRAIRSPDPQARVNAWTRLQRDGEIRGLDREGTINEVLAALDDPYTETRLAAVSALPAIGVDPLVAIDRIASRLGDSDESVKIRAASVLGDVVKRGQPGRDEAGAAIVMALKDPLATVRVAAVASLGQLVYEGGQSADPLRSGHGDDPALGLAVDRLRDDDVNVRVEAAYVLACNDRGGQAVPMLVDYLKAQPPAEPPTHAADRAFLALMVLAINSDPAASFLAGEMAATREGYPERPRDALAWAARQSAEARLRVKRLAGGLLDPANPSLRHNAGLLLHEIGSDQPALPILIEAIEDESLAIRIKAVEALADIGGPDPAVLAALEAATYDSDREVRERAAAALEAIEWAEILSGQSGAIP